MAFKHAEAFCLMLYKCEKCSTIEILYNTRDGVTPFMVNCKQCDGMMVHENWKSDVCKPEFVIPDGMRVFIDLDQKKFEDNNLKMAEKFWAANAYGCTNNYKSVEELAKVMSSDFQQGAPDIITYKTEKVKDEKNVC